MRTTWQMSGLACCLFSVVAGCAAPTRSDPGAFELVASGRVPAPSVGRLVECLTDAFTKRAARNTSLSVRQQRRVDVTRVEVYVSNVSLAVSAYVFDTGATQVYRGNDLLRMHTEEPELFKTCVLALGGRLG